MYREVYAFDAFTRYVFFLRERLFELCTFTCVAREWTESKAFNELTNLFCLLLINLLSFINILIESWWTNVGSDFIGNYIALTFLKIYPKRITNFCDLFRVSLIISTEFAEFNFGFGAQCQVFKCESWTNLDQSWINLDKILRFETSNWVFFRNSFSSGWQ